MGLADDVLSIRSAPEGLEDVSKYPELFATLLASNMWTMDDLRKLAGLNFLRVFREVEKVGALMLTIVCLVSLSVSLCLGGGRCCMYCTLLYVLVLEQVQQRGVPLLFFAGFVGPPPAEAQRPRRRPPQPDHGQPPMMMFQVSRRLRLTEAALPAEEFIAAEDIRDHVQCRSVAKRDANTTAC